MQLHPDTTRAISVEATKAAATGIASLLALSLDTWVKILTLCAILLNAAYSIWKWHRDWRRARRQDAAAP